MRRTGTLGLLMLAAAVFIQSGQSAFAQTNRATITGTVTDPSGAVVAAVDVTITNTGTNISVKTVSNQDGIYVVPDLFPGSYAVQFRKDGFEVLDRTSITLQSTEVVRIDAALKVGSIGETVTVTTNAPVLELERATEGTNMNVGVVEDLPLSIYNGGRFVENFAVALTPGYSPYSSPYGAVVNGGQWFTKEYTIDGTSGTTNIRGDSMEGGPSMESVQELQAQTSGLDAASSVTGGGVMAFNLKSGTNSFHGSALLFGTNELLDANTWTNDYFGEPKGKRRSWDYAFSVGGPIVKDKTFFYATFERYRQIDWRLNGGSVSVPTPNMLRGDFSELLGGDLCTGDVGTGLCAGYDSSAVPIMVQNNDGQTLQAQVNMIYDPTTGNQFTGNAIPEDRISGFAQKINSFYQNYAPQFGGVDNNARGLLQSTPTQTPNWFVVKLDHVLRERDRLSGSWIYNHQPRVEDDSGGVWQAGTQNGGPLSNARNQIYWAHQIRLSENHTFTPNLLNVLNLTYNMDYNASSPMVPGDWNAQLGFGSTGSKNFPLISFNDSNSAYGHSETFIGNTWQGNLSGVNIIVGDSLSWTHGRHSFTFGGDFTAHQVNSRSGSGALSFDFPFYVTSGPGYPYDGFGFATYMLGDVDRASETVAYNLYGRQKELALYAQDSYKATPKLTLSAGLRWNYNFRFHEKYGNWANFDQSAISSIYGIPGTLVFAHSGSDSFEKNEYARNFGPSFGFAYQLKPKTVVRGAFSLIFNPPGVPFFQGVPDGFAPQIGVNNASSFNWDQVPNGYPGVIQQANANTDPTSLFPEVTVDPRALRAGYVESFNFGIQQELTPNMRLEVAYIGNRGHRLTDTALNWNQAPTSTFLNLWKTEAAEGYIGAYADYVCDPGTASYYGVPYPYAGFCGPALAAAAPFPHLAQSEVNYWGYANLLYVGLPFGQSFYDSMVVDVVKRTGRGLTMDMSYTWSRTEGDSFSAQQDYNGYYTPVQDFGKMRQAAHAITGYDLAHVGKGFVSYELPFGKGRQWFNGGGRFLNAVASGWTVTGLVLYNSGQPFAVGAADPFWPLWGNLYPHFNLQGYTGPNSTSHYQPLPAGFQGTPPPGNFYMPTSVASNPAVAELPPSPTSSELRCPGQANEDASVLKNFAIGADGRYRLQFRTEFYNIFNRHYYYINGCAGSHSSVGAGDFGEILGILSTPRQGQFGLRFEF